MIDRLIEEHQPKYSTYESFKVLICSWNIGACKPEALLNTQNNYNTELMKSWFTSMEDEPDIIVIGFQETVDLDSKKITAKSFFKKDKNEKIEHRYKLWQIYLSKSINQYIKNSEYKLVKCNHLIGLFSCVYIKSTHKEYCTNLDSTTVKTGFKGLHGNKGAVSVRFCIKDTSFVFVNCHLAAGQKSVSSRNNDIANIIRKTTFEKRHCRPGVYVNGGDGTQILDHELCFVSGDLNYRIDARRDQIVDCLYAKRFGELIKYDQLHKMLQSNNRGCFVMKLFNEPKINFPPTYKYDLFSDTYDTSEKQRLPAWCDRILYRGGNYTKQTSNNNDQIANNNNMYSKIVVRDFCRYECNVSDHRPISGVFECQVKTIEQGKLNEIARFVEEEFTKYRENVKQNIKINWLLYRGYDVKIALKILEETNNNLLKATNKLQQLKIKE